MKKIMNILMLSCKKATELIDKKIHFGISRQERVRLHMHTMMCNACRNYEKQGRFMDDALKKFGMGANMENHELQDPSREFLDRVIHKLDKN